MLIFIFGWLLMLLTTVTFGIGANTEKCVCEPLMDDSYEIFKQVICKPFNLKISYNSSLDYLNSRTVFFCFQFAQGMSNLSLNVEISYLITIVFFLFWF